MTKRKLIEALEALPCTDDTVVISSWFTLEDTIENRTSFTEDNLEYNSLANTIDFKGGF